MIRSRSPKDTVYLPSLFNVSPDTGSVVSGAAFQNMLDAAAFDRTLLRVPPGEYRVDEPFTFSSGLAMELMPGAHINAEFVPLRVGTQVFTAEGSLSSPYLLSADAKTLLSAPGWVAGATYHTDDRVVVDGFFCRATQDHPASTPTGGQTAQAAFYTDLIAGKWEPSNLQTATDLTDGVTSPISGITKDATGGIVTAVGNTFVDDDWVQIKSAGGMTQVNLNGYRLKKTGDSTFRIYTAYGVPVDTSAYSTYTSGGTVAKLVIAPSTWLAAQSASEKWDTLGQINMLGECVGVDNIVGGKIWLKDILGNTLTTATASFFTKINTIKDISITGGKFTGPIGDVFDNTTCFAFLQCENVRIKDVEVANFYTCFGIRDTINFQSRGHWLHDGYSLAYGFALSDSCRATQILDGSSHRLRHYMTISATPNRAPPRFTVVNGFYVECSQRFRPNTVASSPLGGSADALDDHSGSSELHIMNGTIVNATGAGINHEAEGLFVENVLIQNCNIGLNVGNTTTRPSRIIAKNLTVINAGGKAVSIRSSGIGGGYSEVSVEGYFEGAGTIVVHIEGTVEQRIPKASFRGKVSGSASGSAATRFAYIDNCMVNGATVDTSLVTSQAALTFSNVRGGLCDDVIVVQKSGATGSAISFANTDCAATAAHRANTGNGTLSLSATPVRSGAQDGLYTVRFTGATTYNFLDIDGSTVIDTGTVGVEHTNILAFTVTAGGTSFVSGDGFFLVVTGAAVVVNASKTNTGTGTITVPSAQVIADTMVEGDYDITCTSLAGGAGNETWSVVDRLGSSIGTATTGVPFSSNGVVFTINAGGTNFALADRFVYTGSRAPGDFSFGMLTVTAPNNSTNRGILLGSTAKNVTVDLERSQLAQVATKVTLGSGTGHYAILKKTTQALSADQNETIQVFTHAPNLIAVGGTRTANRTWTFGTTPVFDGATFKVTNTDATYNIALRDGVTSTTLATLTPGQVGSVVYSTALATPQWVLSP